MKQKNSKVGYVTALTFMVYVAHVVFGGLAGSGISKSLFPESVGKVSDELRLFITPTGPTFSIWGVIYFLQLTWIIYTMTGICRSSSGTNILSTRFYVFFMVSTAFITGWLFSWTRKEIVPSFIVVIFHQIFVELAFVMACSDLADYTKTHEQTTDNKADIWCQRILVQNGLLFYATWTVVASLINFAIVLNKELHASDEVSSLIALVILAIATITWFFMESFMFKTYTEYTISAYVTLIWALSGVIAGVWDRNNVVGGVALALLVVCVVLLILRIVIITLRVKRRAAYSNISYSSATNTVSS